ncbi:MAG: BrnA antitoxin family protein [Mangrovicoccus sp.]|nr:BrnA antitoxin family protein [Mangrovicoccus sp.]
MGDEPDDDLPDMSAPYWKERIAKAEVKRGRPKAAKTKVSTTIRLSPEVIEHFKSGGPGWQSRIDEALRKVAWL